MIEQRDKVAEEDIRRMVEERWRIFVSIGCSLR
jgi:hypothetical protein